MHQPWHEDGGLDLAGHWLSGFVRRATPAVWRLGRTSTIDGQNLDVKEPMTVVTKNENKYAPAGNRTRVCTVAGYYSTTRPLVL
jgi:hypothetical protein